MTGATSSAAARIFCFAVTAAVAANPDIVGDSDTNTAELTTPLDPSKMKLPIIDEHLPATGLSVMKLSDKKEALRARRRAKEILNETKEDNTAGMPSDSSGTNNGSRKMNTKKVKRILTNGDIHATPKNNFQSAIAKSFVQNIAQAPTMVVRSNNSGGSWNTGWAGWGGTKASKAVAAPSRWGDYWRNSGGWLPPWNGDDWLGWSGKSDKTPSGEGNDYNDWGSWGKNDWNKGNNWGSWGKNDWDKGNDWGSWGNKRHYNNWGSWDKNDWGKGNDRGGWGGGSWGNKRDWDAGGRKWGGGGGLWGRNDWWTASPTLSPTLSPTFYPTFFPTISPTFQPTTTPTWSPTWSPTVSPTAGDPTFSPTWSPTQYPTIFPTIGPTVTPTISPTVTPPTWSPTISPTVCVLEQQLECCLSKSQPQCQMMGCNLDLCVCTAQLVDACCSSGLSSSTQEKCITSLGCNISKCKQSDKVG